MLEYMSSAWPPRISRTRASLLTFTIKHRIWVAWQQRTFEFIKEFCGPFPRSFAAWSRACRFGRSRKVCLGWCTPRTCRWKLRSHNRSVVQANPEKMGLLSKKTIDMKPKTWISQQLPLCQVKETYLANDAFPLWDIEWFLLLGQVFSSNVIPEIVGM